MSADRTEVGRAEQADGGACTGLDTSAGRGAETGDEDERSEAHGSEWGNVAEGDQPSRHLGGPKRIGGERRLCEDGCRSEGAGEEARNGAKRRTLRKRAVGEGAALPSDATPVV